MRTNADRGVGLIETVGYKTLERKYINSLEKMTKEEIEIFLAMLQENNHAEFAERRISILTKKLESLERLEQLGFDWEKAWRTAAYEYVDITNRWLEIGATWENNETITKWSYKGEVFYTWHSGFRSNPITEEIINTRKADELLMKLTNNLPAT